VIKNAFFILLLICSSTLAVAPLDIRIALVVGNSSYLHAPVLLNPSNDAKAVAVALKKSGFTVYQMLNGTQVEMRAAVDKITAELKDKQAIALFYYAGHGLQLDWRNYMMPVNAKLSKAVDVPLQMVDVGTVVDNFKMAGTRMNIVVLDACRDNPFGATASAKGLAPMDAPPGTILAYATAPGNVAEDGDAESGNGLYTQFLVQELGRPMARIEDVFKRVRLQVRLKSQGRQIPWESTSLEEDFSFNANPQTALRAADLDLMAKEAKEKEQQLTKAANDARERESLAVVALEREKAARELLAATERTAREQAERDKAAAQALTKQRELVAAAAATAEREKELVRLAQEAQAMEAQRLLAAAKAQEVAKEQALAQAREQALATAQAQERARVLAAERAAQTAKDLEAKRQRDVEQALAELKTREAERQMSAERARELRFAAEKADWDRIKDTKANADAQAKEQVYAFLDKYPSGFISELAQLKLEKLDKPQIVSQPEKGGAVQSADAKRFRLGDKYDIVISDLLTKLVQERSSFTVVAADEDTAEFNQGYKVTQAGAIIRTIAGATHEPYQQWIPSGEYQVGKKWTARTILTPKGAPSMWAEITGKVVARESITVPAGTFDTYKMEMEQAAQDGSLLKITYWGQPDWGVAIKQIREVRERNGRLSGQIYELAKRERVR
jgi:uncharacterized caspase-like protein